MHLNGLLIKNKCFNVINKYDEFCILLTSIMKVETVNPGDTIFQKGGTRYKAVGIFAASPRMHHTDDAHRDRHAPA